MEECWILVTSKQCFESCSRKDGTSWTIHESGRSPEKRSRAKHTQRHAYNSKTPLRRRTFLTWNSPLRKMNLQKTFAQYDSESKDSEVRSAVKATFFAGWRAKHQTANIRKARGFQEPSLRSNATASRHQGAGVAWEDKPRHHRDDPRKRSSPCAAPEHSVTACPKRRRKLTRWIDARVTRRIREVFQSIGLEPVHLSGTWTLKIKMILNVNESTAEESKEWNLPIVFFMARYLGRTCSVEVTLVRAQVREYAMDRLQQSQANSTLVRNREVARFSHSRKHLCEVLA